MSKPALIFFSLQGYTTTKSTVKILAAKMHCKYVLKIAEPARPLEICPPLAEHVP
jgi:hypothetical protein